MSELLDLVPSGVPVVVLLDYDGTLVPIRRSPDLAQLGPERREELRQLGKRTFVAIVSGRPLAEIRRMVGLPGLAYIGNHGLEVRVKKRTWVHSGAVDRTRAIARAVEAIKIRTSGLPGIFIEDKGLTASVHFRRASLCHTALLRAVVTEEIRRSRGRLVLLRGKKVLEIRPNVPWDKGRGVLELMRLTGGPGSRYPIYIGDDRTDEDAFRSLRDRGLTIRVGSGSRTLARYRLRRVDDVWAFLAALHRRIAPSPVSE